MSVSYTAVVLDENSRNKILSMIPTDDWEVVLAHHMTINLGPIEKGTLDRNQINQQVTLNAISLAQDEKVIALGVDTNIPSKNSIKHITIAVNSSKGGKPMLSNKLTNWQPIPNFRINGTIQEVGFS